MFDFNYITPKEAAEIGVITDPDKGKVHSVEYYEKLASKTGKCINCENDIWKMLDNEMCFSCTTGEHDASDDYELISL